MKDNIKKFMAICCSVSLLVGTMAVYAGINDGDYDGDISDNPWGENFTTTAYQPPETTTPKVTSEETTTEEITPGETTTSEIVTDQATSGETTTPEVSSGDVTTIEPTSNDTTTEDITQDTTTQDTTTEDITQDTTTENVTTGEVIPTENLTSKQDITTTKVKVPAKAKIRKVRAKKLSAKKAKLSLKRIKGAKGYQIAIYKTKKKAKKNKRAILKKFVKKVRVIVKSKKLKNKKLLYVKARAYVLDAKGKKVYGKWSKAKKIKSKK